MKICVVGCGRWGFNHVRTLAKLGFLGAVVDSNETAHDRIRADFPNVQLFSSLDEPGALNFDAYTIVVPAEYHYSVAKKLLLHDKHILVEKPITLTVQDAESLVHIAKQRNLVLMTGHLLLFHPAIQKIKMLYQDGKLGKLQYMYSNRLNLGTVRKEENSLWSFAPHDVSIFQYLTGDKPLSVTSTGGAFLQPHIHDTTMTVIHYPQNIVGHIFVSWLHPFKEHRLVIIGSKGMLSYEDSSKDKQLLFYEKGIDFINGEPIKRDGPTEVINYEPGAPLEKELQHFIACIEKKEQNTLISGKQGLEVLDILSKADAALQNPLQPPAPMAIKPKDYFLHDTVNVDADVKIGKNTKIWHHSNIQQNASIGEHCIFGQNVNIGTNVTIGNYCKIQNNVSVYEGVELEDYVFCGPSMVFTNINIPRSKYPQAASNFYQKTLVKEGASIGANATIVCGITLGKHCFIGAGSVVTKSVPDYAIVVGNPGKIVGWISETGEKLDFSNQSSVTCQKSKITYLLENDRVTAAAENEPAHMST